MIILILFLQNGNSHNLILCTLTVDIVCFCLVLSHLVFSENVSPGCRLAFIEVQVARKFFFSAFSLVTCSEVIKDLSGRSIERELRKEKERNTMLHHASLFLCICFFHGHGGTIFEQKYLFIVVKGTMWWTTMNCTDNIETAEYKDRRKEIFTKNWYYQIEVKN